MQKKKQKIYRKYEDFYTAEDLRNTDPVVRINLSINDFDARGLIRNPRAPCVVTSIDPSYIKDAGQQRLAKKFRVKTDILQLREITRKKFMIYATQQRYLEKQQECEYNEQEYKRITKFHEFAETSLKEMEKEAFNEMVKVNEELKNLQELKVADELKIVNEDRQQVVMEVQEVYSRFLFLLKLIGYFDDIGEDDCDCGESLVRPAEITEINMSEKNPAGRKEIEQLKTYMDTVVRPYLAKRNHLKADVWIKGYERTRHKIFNYNRHLANVAVLNHIFSIVYEKFQKTYARRIIKPMFLRDPDFMKKRVVSLKERATNIFTDFVGKHKVDKLSLKLNAIVPIILQSVEQAVAETNANGQPQAENLVKHSVKGKNAADTAEATPFKDEHETVLTKVEKIQGHLLNLLNKFDAMPPELHKAVEKRIRREVFTAKEMSRRALVKQNRLHNWMEHFKKHELQKNK